MENYWSIYLSLAWWECLLAIKLLKVDYSLAFILFFKLSDLTTSLW